MTLNRREVLAEVYKAAVRFYKHGNVGNSYPDDYFIDESHILPHLRSYEIVVMPPFTVAKLVMGNIDAPPAYGVAKCSCHDEFDIDIGRRIAISRATREWLKRTALVNVWQKDAVTIGCARPDIKTKGVHMKNQDINPYDTFPKYVDLDQTKLVANRLMGSKGGL